MYLVKIPANIEDNLWYKNGGRLIVNALLDGEFNEIDENGDLKSILPSELTAGIEMSFEKSHKFFKGHEPYGIKIKDTFSATSEKIPLIQDVFNILPDTKWGVFDSVDAMELMRICHRIKNREEMPIEFSEIRSTLSPLRIIYYTNYDKETTLEDREILFKYCITTNNLGIFLFFPDFYQGENKIKELANLNLTEREIPFSEAVWLCLKYSSYLN